MIPYTVESKVWAGEGIENIQKIAIGFNETVPERNVKSIHAFLNQTLQICGIKISRSIEKETYKHMLILTVVTYHGSR